MNRIFTNTTSSKIGCGDFRFVFWRSVELWFAIFMWHFRPQV